jgi:ketosteroid isomerase-like protein
LNANEQLVDSFYAAFANRDYQGMARCYHDDIRFSDPVFTNLNGKEVGAMWHMLCEQGTDLRVGHSEVSANGDDGSARWEARYSFGPDGRQVHNSIRASFEFRDGKIVNHRDRFDLWKWTRMAIGGLGTVLGWSSFVQKRVRSTARRSLDRFIESHPEYTDTGN